MPDSNLDSLPLFRHPSRNFRASHGGELRFEELVRQFSKFGHSSVDVLEGNIPYLVNEFWTSGQRQAHSLHEISYRACFKPQLPEFFIERLTGVGDAVYDPFMGRGTTPVQAALMGRKPVGNDINPLSILLTRPRLQPPNIVAVANRLGQVRWNSGVVRDEELLAFYSPQTLSHLDALRSWLFQQAPLDASPDPIDDWIRMVAINRLTGHSSGFFSVYTLPPNQAVSAGAQRKINEQRSQTPPDRDLPKLILKKSGSLLADGYMGPHPEGVLVTGSSWATPVIPDASVALVVTSPPFLDIVQYAEDNWLRSWFAGIDVGAVKIAHHKTESAWQGMIRDTLCELARVTRPGGHVAFEVGDRGIG